MDPCPSLDEPQCCHTKPTLVSHGFSMNYAVIFPSWYRASMTALCVSLCTACITSPPPSSSSAPPPPFISLHPYFLSCCLLPPSSLHSFFSLFITRILSHGVEDSCKPFVCPFMLRQCNLIFGLRIFSFSLPLMLSLQLSRELSVTILR